MAVGRPAIDRRRACDRRFVDIRGFTLTTTPALAAEALKARLPDEVPAEVDRSGWPVLVKDSKGDYDWPDGGGLAVWRHILGGWSTYKRGHDYRCVGTFDTAQAAAEALHVRLPDEAPPADPSTGSVIDRLSATVSKQDAEIADLRERIVTVMRECDGFTADLASERDRRMRAEAEVQHLRRQVDDARDLRARLAFLCPDGLVTDAGIVTAAKSAEDARHDLTRAAGILLDHGQEPLAWVDLVREVTRLRTGSVVRADVLIPALDLLDAAAERDQSLAPVAALVRVGVGL